MQSVQVEKASRFFIEAAPLFLVLFIDSMGLGLVFPLLNTLVLDPNSHFISTMINTNARHVIYGVTVSIYMFCWFFGAAFLGDLSDQVGRKKGLMICLLGAVGGYLFSALAVLLKSYALLLIGRIIAGFTAGSQSIAQAAIVDMSEPTQKSRNLGLILFFTSLGFVFGPIAGGVLSDSDLLKAFNYTTPFYFAAVISLLNMALLHYLFDETFVRAEKIHFKFHHAIHIFISAFKHEKIRGLSCVLLIMIFGWSSFYSFISMYLFRVYQFSALETGVYMGMMGMGFGIGSGFLMEPLTKRLSLKQCVIWGCLAAAIITILTVIAPKEFYIWIYVVMITVGIAIAYSAILTLFSNQVDEHAQGWVMGITGAIMAFAFGVNGVLLGVMADANPAMPLIVCSLCLVITAGLMRRFF